MSETVQLQGHSEDNGLVTTNTECVTFGDHGSLIETLIDDSIGTEINHNYKDTEEHEHKVYPKERYVTDDTCDIQDLSPIKPQKNRVKFSEEDLCTNRSEAESISDDDSEVVGIIKRAPSTESRDNPFQPDGDISKSADMILRHSKISASEVVIVDPSSPGYKETRPQYDTNENREEKLSPVLASPVSNQPDNIDGNSKLRENGTVEETVSPEQVQVVESSPKQDGEASPATSPEEANPTDKKDEQTKKKKCCTIL